MPKHTRVVKEDFACANCRREVKGNGRTNHCPSCLWSQHKDDEVPGDRASICQGMMRPIGVWVEHGEITRIEHECVRCHLKRFAPVLREDDRELLIKISVADIRK